MSILLAPMQDLENAWIELLTERGVNTAVGAQLDIIGRIVGQLRAGLSDDVYRRYLRARIAANRSQGHREDLLNIAALVYGTPTTATFYEQDQSIATWYLRVDNIATDGPTMTALTAFIKSAVAAGVRPLVQTSPTDESGMFEFSGGSGLGFDDTTAPGSGGQLADIRDGNVA